MKIILRAGPLELVKDVQIPERAIINSVMIDVTNPLIAIGEERFSVEDLRITRWSIEGRIPDMGDFEIADEPATFVSMPEFDGVIVDGGTEGWKLEVLGGAE